MITKETYLQSIAFAKRIDKFRDSLCEGMYLTVYIYTGDQKVDCVPRKAKVLKTYKRWCLLEDEKGLKYGPNYHTLLQWGNN